MMAMLDKQRINNISNSHKESTAVKHDLDASLRSNGSTSSPIYNDVSTLPSNARRVGSDVASFSRSQLQILGMLGKKYSTMNSLCQLHFFYRYWQAVNVVSRIFIKYLNTRPCMADPF
jgi:hypothetical protein